MSQVSATYRAETEADLRIQARAGAAKWFGVNLGCVDVAIVGNVRQVLPGLYVADTVGNLAHRWEQRTYGPLVCRVCKAEDWGRS